MFFPVPLHAQSRLKIAGAENPDIFSPGAIDYIFRCTAGIPRAINNLCDNALLNGFAAGERMISRAIIQEVAETFDVLPRIARVEEREAPARIFPAASRAELWSAGRAETNGNGKQSEAASEFIAISPAPEPDIIFNERAIRESPTSIEDLTSVFSRPGLGRGNNG